MNHGSVYDLTNKDGAGTACTINNASRWYGTDSMDKFLSSLHKTVTVDGEIITFDDKSFGHLPPNVNTSDGSPSGCGTCFMVKTKQKSGSPPTSGSCNVDTVKHILIMGTDTFEPTSPEIGETPYKTGMSSYPNCSDGFIENERPVPLPEPLHRQSFSDDMVTFFVIMS